MTFNWEQFDRSHLATGQPLNCSTAMLFASFAHIWQCLWYHNKRFLHCGTFLYHRQGWGQVKYLYMYLVLDANYWVLGTYLYLTIWNSKVLGTYLYLMAKVLDTCPSTQVLCQINKYSVLNLWIVLVNNSPLNTISRNGSYWLCWQHGSQDVNSQDWTVSLIYRRSLVQVATCLQFGASQ